MWLHSDELLKDCARPRAPFTELRSSGTRSPGLFSDLPDTADLRQIYQTPTADQAAVESAPVELAAIELAAFEATWNNKYASIAPAWQRAWGK